MRRLARVSRQARLIAMCVALLMVVCAPVSAAELPGTETPISGVGASVSALAADDVAPGIDIIDASDYPSSIVRGSLNAATDTHDYLKLYAAPGEQITLFAEVPAGSSLNLGMNLLRWNGGAPQFLRPSFASGDTEWLCYTVPESHAAGVYYVDVLALSGADTYELRWAVTSRSDGNIPGVPLPASPFDDDVSTQDDVMDVFEVHIGVGQSLSLGLTTIDPTDMIRVYVYGPSATDVWTSGSITASGVGSNIGLLLPSRGPGEAGKYYVAVYAASDASAEYTLTWSVASGGINMPGMAMPAGSPFTTFIGAGDRVYYVDLEYGQRIDVDLKVVAGGASMKLFGPNAVDTSNASVAAGDPISYWVSSAQAGRHYLLLHPTLPGSSVTITYSITDGVEREAGSDRYATSALVSKADFPKGADVVVVATGADFPDALSASSLAGAYGAPVLLTKPTALPASVKNEITRLGATRCFIVGGEVAVNPSVVAAIDAVPGMTTPVRLAGSDRYSTAAAVAEATLFRTGGRNASAFVARGDDFADALSLAPIGWASMYPILLTKPNALPAATASLLAERPILSVMIAGGTAAVSIDVEDEIDTIIAGGADATGRREGANRYATAAVIAEWSATSPWLDWSYVGLATGVNFPDALGGGAGAARKGGVLLLTRPNELAGNTSSMMNAYKDEIRSVQLLGGTAALENSVESAVGSIVQ